MKRTLLILLALTACNRDPGRSGGSIGLTPKPPTQPPSTPTQPGDVSPNFFVVGAGQSNMVGYGALPGTIPDNENVMVFRSGKWMTANDPLYDEGGGVGPGKAFGVDIVNLFPGTKVGIIPCAVGGSTIGHWLPGEEFDVSCQKKIRAALPPGGHVNVVLWLQGESDAQDPNYFPNMPPFHAKDYAYCLSKVISGFRAPVFIIAQIGTIPAFDPARFPNWELVQKEQDSMNSPTTPVIHTSDLNPDGVLHFHTQEAQEIGHRFAKAYWSFANNFK